MVILQIISCMRDVSPYVEHSLKLPQPSKPNHNSLKLPQSSKPTQNLTSKPKLNHNHYVVLIYQQLIKQFRTYNSSK